MIHFTNEELISFIPSDSIVWDDSRVSNSKKTQALLGWFIFNCGLEEYKVNGSFYRSNTDLMEDIETTSNTTLIEAINKLVLGGYISRIVGTRKGKKASIYSVNLDKINTKRTAQTPIPNPTTPINYSTTPMTTPMSDWSSAIMEQNNAILLELKKIGELLEVIASRTTPMNNYATMPSEWSTDIDTEIEKEKDIELDENIYSNNIKAGKENVVEVNDNIQSNVVLVGDINYSEIKNTEERLHIDNPLSVEEVMENLFDRNELEKCETMKEFIVLSTETYKKLKELQLDKSVLDTVKERLDKEFSKKSNELTEKEREEEALIERFTAFLCEEAQLDKNFATYDEMSKAVRWVEDCAKTHYDDGTINREQYDGILRNLHSKMDYRLECMLRARSGSRA